MTALARLLLAALALATSTALAEGPARRTVAVLEYRAGAGGLQGVGERLAARLAHAAALQVLGPQECRRRAGAGIDADLARCAGAASCTGRLGRLIGAQEVLLVGVSQLGDLVLAIQRIDAGSGVVLGRLATSLSASEEPSDEQLLGWLQQLFPPDAFLRFGTIKILANLDGAQVRIDGAERGRTPLKEPLAVSAPAEHHVLIDKPGFVPFDARLDVPPDATVEVRAQLVSKAEQPPWYKRWYVWAVIGGAAVVAGAGVAIYYGTRVDPTPVGYIRLPP